MNFTLQKSISIDPVTINGANVQIGNHTKLLGVTYDSHMKFTNRVDNVISQSRSAYDALVNLKKAGVATSGLVLFYQARILSIISYAAPSWYPYIAKYYKDKLERYQRLCLFIILPRQEHYADRLVFLKLEELNVYLDIVCLRYANKILADDHHILHRYIPGRPSTHSRRTIPPKSRTAHLGKNLFFRYFWIIFRVISWPESNFLDYFIDSFFLVINFILMSTHDLICFDRTLISEIKCIYNNIIIILIANCWHTRSLIDLSQSLSQKYCKKVHDTSTKAKKIEP